MKKVIIIPKNLLMESYMPKVIWYHGSDHDFSSFEEFNSSGPSALGIFFTDDLGLAELFGKNVYVATIHIQNPYKITMDKWDALRGKYAKQTEYFIQMREKLISEGYDGLLIKSRKFVASSGTTFIDGKIVVVFDKKNIKLKEKL